MNIPERALVVTRERRAEGSGPRLRRRSARAGFTLLEMAIVLIIGGILIGMATLSFSAVNTRRSARRAAQVFSRDLALARSMAVRERQKVVVRFHESALAYEVETASGREVVSRRFGPDYDVDLDGLTLGETGDSIVFSNRGIATLGGALGTATFQAGSARYAVTFNGMGAAQVGAL